MENIAKQLMNYYWLRPETVLWRLRDIELLQNIELKGRSLDLCCGDGIYSFIRSGGEFSTAYDAFVDVKKVDKFFDGEDIYADCLDSWDPSFIKKFPKNKIDVGYDWKQGLLDKAERLGLYGELIQGDANEKLNLPDESFDSVFSNAIYWMNNIEGLLGELNRVLTDSGQLVVSVPDQGFVDSSLYGKFIKQNQLVPEYVTKLDRGRFHDNFQTVRSDEDWQLLFKESNFKVVEHKKYLSSQTIEAWDIGLRPFSPYLIRMQHKLSPKDLLDIKTDWVNEITPIAFEYFQGESLREAETGTGFNLYHLEKIG